MVRMTPGEKSDPPTLAEQELLEAKRDPRLDRGREAMVADWWSAMRAAERTRRLGIWGLHELTLSLEREETRVGFRRGDPGAQRKSRPPSTPPASEPRSPKRSKATRLPSSTP